MLKSLDKNELECINGGTRPTSNDPAVDRGLGVGYFIGRTIRETLNLIF